MDSEDTYHAKPEADTLTEKQLPYFMCERCADQRKSLKSNAEQQCSSCSIYPCNVGCEWGYEQCLRYRETSDKSELQCRSSGVIVVGQVVGKKDAVGGVDAPSMCVYEKSAHHADPAITSIRWLVDLFLFFDLWLVCAWSGDGYF